MKIFLFNIFIQQNFIKKKQKIENIQRFEKKKSVNLMFKSIEKLFFFNLNDFHKFD